MKSRLLLFPVLLMLVVPLWSQEHPTTNTQLWNTLFEDDCSTFKQFLWVKDDSLTHGNPNQGAEEPQVYLKENVYIDDGKIVLKTEEISTPLQLHNHNNCMYNNRHYYTSGQIHSWRKYQYGYYEIYAKLPISEGYWPAFWFYDSDGHATNPWYNEIDVMEGDGAITDTLSCAYHWGYSPLIVDLLSSVKYYPSDYADGYHWYGVQWDKNEIFWLFDRNVVRVEKNDMMGVGIQHPMRIIINVALFPNNWSNHPVSNNTIFPNYMKIDQINGYQLNCQDKDVIVNEIFDFTTYNYHVKKSITLSGATILPQNSSISLYARDYILLNNDFSIPLGVEFVAGVCDGCND